jgi:hypothetical protein
MRRHWLIPAIVFIAISLQACAAPLLTNDLSNPKTELQLEAEEFCRKQRGEDAELPPKRFTTDGCSLWPDSDWQECCVTHDMAYWCGGTAGQRAEADERLQQCVRENGHPNAGTFMRLGTRLSGWWVLPTPWRWGYGWSWLESGN